MVTKENIKNFPDKPGVYIIKDKAGQVIYVGKAISLKKRLASYFSKFVPSFKTEIMLSYACDIEFRQTASEYDALILESSLIKRYKPRFNISLKDDKSFPYIKISREEFPRVSIGRMRKGEEGFDYFGPYTNAKLLRQAFKVLRKSFPFCSCRAFPKKVCLNYHMGLCAGPCQKKISKKRYIEIIRNFEDFLTKKDSDLIDELSVKMRDLVRQEKFEDAANLRDELEALGLLVSLKKIDAQKGYSYETDFEQLGLTKEPKVIEFFDISNIGANEAVGSMVSFYNGRPDKDNYRRFKIRTVSGVDDYAMIAEVMRRRYERLLSEAKKMPDLIVIDGGMGHLEAALAILKKLKLFIPIIAIAKSQELIYTVGNKNPLKLRRQSQALRLIQYGRDEAHRFALKYHHLLRKKQAFNK